MGRPRSKYSCPKCKQPGYKEHNASRNGNYPNLKYRKYWRVVHYDSLTKKKIFVMLTIYFGHWRMKNEYLNMKRDWNRCLLLNSKNTY